MSDPLRHFGQVWLWDFEFSAPAGERPSPVCMVAREWRTGQTVRLWSDELTACAAPPFAIDAGALCVAYYASAELGCHLALGWPMPARVLDLYAEFGRLTAGRSMPWRGRSLIGALSAHGIDSIDATVKDDKRQLAMRGGHYSASERAALLDYCESDVVALAKLLPAMLPNIDLPRALLRGRYAAAVARMEWNGTPLDAVALAAIRTHWQGIKSRLIAAVDAEYGCYVPTNRRKLDPANPLGAAILDTATQWNLDPYRLAEALDHLHAQERQKKTDQQAAIREARQQTGLTRRRIEQWEQGGQRDHASYPHFDVTARELAAEHPALGIGAGYTEQAGADDTDYAGELWTLLREPERQPRTKRDPSLLREAAELVAASPTNGAPTGPMSFSAERFATWLTNNGIPWPRLDSGALALDDATFRQMAKAYPSVAPLRELRHTLGELRLNELAVGADGRNRCLLSPFASKTSRNQPSNSRFIFGPSVWLRGLIRPEAGRAVAYLDWEQQEFGIAAALSGDAAMIEAYASGDPYLTFAKQAGAVPADATKATHKAERDRFKVCALAVQYGMGEQSLANALGTAPIYARELLRLHRQTYPRFWHWSNCAVDLALLQCHLDTVFGWRVHVESGANARSLANFPMQANGAEMLRLACCLATEQGLSICAPVHDALLIEADARWIERSVSDCQAAMREASRLVLNGFELRTEAKIVRAPDRYMDDRGQKMWDTVARLVRELEQAETAIPF